MLVLILRTCVQQVLLIEPVRGSGVPNRVDIAILARPVTLQNLLDTLDLDPVEAQLADRERDAADSLCDTVQLARRVQVVDRRGRRVFAICRDLQRRDREHMLVRLVRSPSPARRVFVRTEQVPIRKPRRAVERIRLPVDRNVLDAGPVADVGELIVRR